MYSSTCFGRPHAHHQELNDCSNSLWFYRWNVVVAVLLVVVVAVRPPDRPDHDQQHCYHHDPKVKPEAATVVIELLMMGGKTPETCWAVNKCQNNKMENCCTWLVIYLNCTIMHGLTNLKFINNNAFDFYFLIWSLSRLLCCVGSGSNVPVALDRAATWSVSGEVCCMEFCILSNCNICT